MDIEKRIYNGNRAQEVLENEAFSHAFNDLKDEVIEQWKQSPVRDEAGRQELWRLLKIAEKFEAILRTTLETGTMAKLDLQHQKSIAEKAKSFLGMN